MLPGTKFGCHHGNREVRVEDEKKEKKRCPTAQSFVMDLVNHVQTGKIPEARINDAVRRILTVKKENKILEKPIAPADWLDKVGIPPHRQLAREAVRQSTVLLKNDN